MAAIDLSNSTLLDPVAKGINDILPKLPAGLFALVFGLILIRVLSWIARAILGLIRLPAGFRGILSSLIDGLLLIFLIIVVLQALGLANIALVFSGSVALVGLAIATGAGSVTSDVMAGLFLARDRDFNVGDELRAGDGPTEGVVESMDMRRTRLRAKNGQLHVIPNSVIERREWVVVAKKRDMK
jgi:small-conductance mechanosensitive channel